MNAEVAAYFMHAESLEKKLEFSIVWHFAPLLKRVKASGLFSIEESERMILKKVLAHTQIAYCMLGKKKGRFYVLLYDKTLLKELLFRSEYRKCLTNYGYEGATLLELLQTLCERMKCYFAEGSCYPHEIGLFLGYPVHDVIGFEACGGKKYLISDYWKVYENQLQANLQFWSYDRARVSAVNEYLSGKNICEIQLQN